MDRMGSQEPKARFRKLQSFKADYASVTMTQYESNRSGMQVVVVDRQGPKVNGYFALATEIFDDSGAPHTLEHLVFLGSRSYHYKGLLDKLASLAYGSTNAWTARENTTYTLETAGWAGFAQTLPVYLEHLLLPTLTDAGCLTEVHHIDGEGNDAGVVYSEMQGIQNNADFLMDLRANRLLYPEHVGYRYETGGMMECLRVLTPDKIRDFHKTMYQSRNLCLIIIGEVDHTDLQRILTLFEDSIEADIPLLSTPFKRPWIDSVQPPMLGESVVETVEFPEEDESIGDVTVAFFGPACTDLVATTAMEVLGTYLCGSSASVLQNIMVEKEELASAISTWPDARPNSLVWFSCSGVATKKLHRVQQRLVHLIKEVASGPLDLTYMRECVRREKTQIEAQAEESQEFYSTNIIADFLFGKRDGSTLRNLASLGEYDVLETWTEEEWRVFMKKWLADAHYVGILGKPSSKLAAQLKESEATRIEGRKKELGAEGLDECRRRLEAAKKKNEVKIPASVLERWPVPPVESIHFIESLTARAGLARELGTKDNAAQKVVDSYAETSRMFMQFGSVPTSFVHISLHIGTSSVPVELKPLLSTFSDILFNLAIEREGKRVEFEQVIMDLQRDTITYGLEGGSRVGDAEGILIRMQVEADKYSKGIEWLRTVMLDSIFDAARIKASVNKQLADIPDAKRDGDGMATEVDSSLHTKHAALAVAESTLVQAVYLKRIKRLLEKDAGTVVSWFEQIRNSLFTLDNIRVHVTADVVTSKLPDPVGTWSILYGQLKAGTDSINPIVKPHTLLNEDGQKPGSVGAVIVPMTAIDSSFSISRATGPTSYGDAAIPALLVAIQYLEAVEGTLWNAVRGNGLAYGAYFSKRADGGFVQFRVFRSPLASKAITAARDAVAALADGSVAFEKVMLEGAVSQIVRRMADQQETMVSSSLADYTNGVVRGLDPDFDTKLLARVRDVTVDQIRDALKTWLLPVFEPKTSNVVVTCAPVMVESLERELQAMGYKTQVKQLSDMGHAYGLEGDEEGAEEGESEEGESEEGESEEGESEEGGSEEEESEEAGSEASTEEVSEEE